MAQIKERLDIILVQQGFFPSRERARGAIMAGLVQVDGVLVDKPGTKLPLSVTITVTGNDLPYVSRGGWKLRKAIEELGFDPTGKVMLDIGASTGGFTDCALQNGASKVYAVDVGYAQLAWSLRQDPRVVVLERTNVRYLTEEQVPEPADAATIDVSFISLGLVLPPVVRLLREHGEVIGLIKPQFEAGRDQIGKHGVVRDASVHQSVIKRVLALAREEGLALRGLTFSPITGPEGNVEFLAYWQLGGVEVALEPDVQTLVSMAHQELQVGRRHRH
jgi:23S rRNA (cytidine1920-2'-O)/16S rRNA (cytidine1409-2'-O)-methyltransferase